MELQLGNSRTWNQMVFHSPKTNQWEFILVFGMLMIGPQEVALLRQIGPMLLSPLLIETSMLMHALCLLEHHLVVQHNPIRMLGFLRSWILQVTRGSSGCRRIIWFITTALIPKDFLRAFLKNAGWFRKIHNSDYLNLLYCFVLLSFLL